MMKSKTLRDPVHGDIQLTQQELRITDTPEFQRLRGIRQLGTSYLVFPGAQHTRFEHSIGTCWILKQLIGEINTRAANNGLASPISREETDFLAIAALLHDITHIPFGHTFEDERRIIPAHDKSQARLHHFLDSLGLGQVLRDLGIQDQLLEFFTAGKSQLPSYAYDLVAGPICADLLDYLKRDAYYCGLKLDYDFRIFKYLTLEAGHLCFSLHSERGFRQDAWTELINLLRMRFHLTERVYYHHAKVVAGAMLSRLLEAMLEQDVFRIEELYGLRDDSFTYLLGQRIDQVHEFEPLWHAYSSRRLYKRVYMVSRDPLTGDSTPDTVMQRIQNDFHLNQRGARGKLERKLARSLGIPVSALILYAPESEMRLKEANVQVRVDSGPMIRLSDVHHPELDALRDGHRALWHFYLFLDRRYEDKTVRAAQLIEKEIGLPNQLELHHRGQLTFRF